MAVLIVLRAGDVGSDEHELIDGGAGQDILILNGFNQRDLPELSTARPGLGDTSLSDPRTGGTYRLLGIEQIQHTHLFTHVGTSEQASFVFVNPSTTAASTGRVAFFNTSGSRRRDRAAQMAA